MLKLEYYDHIKNMSTACATLQSSKIRFTEDQSALQSLDETADLLTIDELKVIAKEAKCNGGNKAQLIAGLKKAFNGQGCLGLKGELKLSYNEQGRYGDQSEQFLWKMLDITGEFN